MLAQSRAAGSKSPYRAEKRKQQPGRELLFVIPDFAFAIFLVPEAELELRANAPGGDTDDSGLVQPAAPGVSELHSAAADGRSCSSPRAFLFPILHDAHCHDDGVLLPTSHAHGRDALAPVSPARVDARVRSAEPGCGRDRDPGHGILSPDGDRPARGRGPCPSLPRSPTAPGFLLVRLRKLTKFYSSTPPATLDARCLPGQSPRQISGLRRFVETRAVISTRRKAIPNDYQRSETLRFVITRRRRRRGICFSCPVEPRSGEISLRLQWKLQITLN